MRSNASDSSRATHASSDNEWLLSAARFLGSAARVVRVGAGRIAGAGRSPAVRPRRREANEIAALVRKLANLVNAHAAAGYASLAHDASFWQAVDRLNSKRPTANALRGTAPETEPPAAQADVEVDGPKRQTLPSAAEPPAWIDDSTASNADPASGASPDPPDSSRTK